MATPNMAPTTTTLMTSRMALMAILTFFASISTANILITLSEVEIITAIAAPIGCILAYNTPIFACDVQDFSGSNSCSVQCERALESVQENIQRSCSQITAPMGSLIYQAQHGNLAKALCQRDTHRPTSIPTQPSADNPPSPTTSLLRFTVSDCTTPLDVTVTATTTQTRRITMMPPPSPSTSEVPTTEASATEISTTDISTTKASTKEAETSTSTSEKLPPPAKTTSTSQARNSATQVASDPEASSTASADKDKPTTAVYRGGGGTPFDNTAPASEAQQLNLSSAGLACMLGVALLMLVW